MSLENMFCQRYLPRLRSSSDPWVLSSIFKPYRNIKRYLIWHIENRGLLALLSLGMFEKKRTIGPALDDEELTDPEVLNLQPGELVEVKSIEEILGTLDRKRHQKGLLWMTGMRKFCRKRYKVKKRVERIILEANGELRKMKNTVILENVTCDGKLFGNCDRSCFHFWREVWLRRVTGELSPDNPDVKDDRA